MENKSDQNLNMDIQENKVENNVENNVENSEENIDNTPKLTPEQKAQLLNKKVVVTMNLLINLRLLLEASVNRGTFKAAELSQVGSVYDDLNSVVNSNLNLE